MQVVIYARYSSHNQTEQSIDGQILECTSFIERNNYTLVGTYIDRAKSGTNDNREQFQKMMSDSAKGLFNGVVVYQLDRLGRNMLDSVTNENKLKNNGVCLLSARENINSQDASTMLYKNIQYSMNEYYSYELSQKVKRGMSINAKNFYYNGGSVPLGLKLESVKSDILDSHNRQVTKKIYVIDDEKAPIVKIIFEMFIGGALMVEIRNYLNDKGYKTAFNKEFNKNSIKSILTNKKYIGTYIYNDDEYTNAIPKIIDHDTFNKVQSMLNIKPGRKSVAKNEFILTTKLFCGLDNVMMIGTSGTSKTNKVHHYYKCQNAFKHTCKKKTIKKDLIESVVVEKAKSILTTENINKIAKIVYETSKRENKNSCLELLQKQLIDKNKQVTNLVLTSSNCDIESVKNSYYIEIKKLNDEIKDIEQKIYIEQSNNIEISVHQVKCFLNTLKKGNINDIHYKKALINTLIYKVFLYDDDTLTIIFNTQQQVIHDKIPTKTTIDKTIQDYKSSNECITTQPYLTHLNTQTPIFAFVGGFYASFTI